MDEGTGVSYHPSTGIVYNSQSVFDFGYFIARLHDPDQLSIVEHVRTLSFNLPHDNMVGSGVIGYLKGTSPSPSHRQLHSMLTRRTVRKPDPRPSHRLPGDLGVVADMCRSLLENYNNDTSRVPTRKWFQVIVRLVRCCVNAETVEVPYEWGEVRWYDGNFPKIDSNDPLHWKRQLYNGRWRFGRNPVVVERSYKEVLMDEEEEMREISLEG
jgi:hypothetical protein